MLHAVILMSAICTGLNFCKIDLEKSTNLINIELWTDVGNIPAKLIRCGTIDKDGYISWRAITKNKREYRCRWK